MTFLRLGWYYDYRDHKEFIDICVKKNVFIVKHAAGSVKVIFEPIKTGLRTPHTG